MPTYEYECKKCSHNFEVFQAMSEPPLQECPKCGSEVRRLIFGGSGVIFKGSGFYVNDKGKSSRTESKTASGKKAEPAACSQCPAGETGKCPASAPESKSA